MDIFAEVVTFPFRLCGGCPFLTGFGDSQKSSISAIIFAKKFESIIYRDFITLDANWPGYVIRSIAS